MSAAAHELELNDDRRHGGRRIDVTVHVTEHPVQTFQTGAQATLLEVMERAAKSAGVALLPPRQQPFDRLHSMRGESVGPVIEHLGETLGDYLRDAGHSPHFTVELARAIQVNNRWDEAPKKQMTPREILALPRIHLDPTEYTLYRPESTAPLPLDTPVDLLRGTDLEAQRDGKYGGGQ